MTRFQMELSGKLGQFWQTEAQKELERVKSDLDSCKIMEVLHPRNQGRENPLLHGLFRLLRRAICT